MSEKVVATTNGHQKEEEGAQHWHSDDRRFKATLTYSALDVASVEKRVRTASSGAVAIFIGTTRADPKKKTQGKEGAEDNGQPPAKVAKVNEDGDVETRVVHLEYEAYPSMALKEMRKIIAAASDKWPIEHMTIWHRLGVVPVLEASVCICVSCGHRRESLEAVHWAIDELKRTVPIWKKEVFADGSVWKENCEGCRRH